MKKGEVEVILVGNELLKGERRDAHLAYVGTALATAGARVTGAHVIGDDPTAIAGLIRDRADDARAIVVSGGLGPTHDDITREGVAAGLGLELVWDEAQWKVINRMFERTGMTTDDSNRRQAYFPAGAEVMPNPRGTAAGFMVERSDLLVAVLPGPPREFNPMLDSHVVPRIAKIFDRPPLFRETFRTTGIGESTMTPLVSPIFDAFADRFDVSSLPHLGGVDIVLTAKPGAASIDDSRSAAADFEAKLRDVLGDKVYAKGAESLESVVGRMLTERGETLAIAESLTGGLIGKRVTDVPGSSAYLLADVVAYSNAAKVDFLGVAEASLEHHGAVSETVCREMAEGVRHRTGATWGISTTGIAGPDGGTESKPVGLTWYGVAWQGGHKVAHRVFPGMRGDVRERVVFAALLQLYRILLEKPKGRTGLRST